MADGRRRVAGTRAGIVGRAYLERSRPVTVLIQWGVQSHGETRGGPRNVLIERVGGEHVVRPFRGLRRIR